MSSLPWFRLYHRIIDDEKLRLLAFEDRWHFVALCCLKADGLLDEERGPLWERKVAVKLGVQLRELDEISRRLHEVGLIDGALSRDRRSSSSPLMVKVMQSTGQMSTQASHSMHNLGSDTVWMSQLRQRCASLQACARSKPSSTSTLMFLSANSFSRIGTRNRWSSEMLLS